MTKRLADVPLKHEILENYLALSKFNQRAAANNSTWFQKIERTTQREFEKPNPLIRIIEQPRSTFSTPVLVNRVYRTPQDAPEFSRGVPSWWGLQGCTRCVLFKNNHIVSHVMFLVLAQCVNFSQILKRYLSESVNFLYFLACFFVMLVRWPSLDHESFVSSVQSPFS